MRDYGIGDDPSLSTDWTGSIYDSSWYFNPAQKIEIAHVKELFEKIDRPDWKSYVNEDP